MELTLGEVAGAVGDAEQSVIYADRSGDAFQRMSKRTTHADALHQAGRRAEAEARFREAEQMQAEWQPEYPLLYSVQGSQYCDLLLAEAERAAWQRFVVPPSGGKVGATIPHPPEGGTTNAALASSCRAVSQRAAQTLKESEEYAGTSLLDIALDHLTLGRAALYAAILEQSAIRNAQSEIDAAVSGLRRAGTQHHLVRGLLTRAWLRRLTGAGAGSESAQSDLDEAWEIAARGSMRLHQADIHLHRARLFGGRNQEEDYPWESAEADLAAAEKLIEECGYHRRDEELAEARQTILGQALR